MPDTLDETGLTLKSLPDLVTELTDSMKGIFGEDINVESDTPDGQQINIVSQLAIDLREILQDIYTSFDPDQAQGTILDQRVGINGIVRSGATYTRTPVSITVDRSLTLTGLDEDSESADVPAGVYTVKDDAGNQFVLDDTVALIAGTHSLTFRSTTIGAVEVSVNTITTAVTAIAGVTAINNPSGVTTQGVDEETDASLRIRRQRSLANSSTGYLDSIEGNLLAVDGVVTAKVYENNTNVTDSDGIPPYSIWAIVDGGTDADIAQILYAKKSAGAGFYGDEEVTVLRPDGREYITKFDRPTNQNLYIKFSLALPGGVVDPASIKQSIVDGIIWETGEDATGDTVTFLVKNLDSRYRITGMLLSDDNATWLEQVTPTSLKHRFVNDVSRITIT